MIVIISREIVDKHVLEIYFILIYLFITMYWSITCIFSVNDLHCSLYTLLATSCLLKPTMIVIISREIVDKHVLEIYFILIYLFITIFCR